MIWLAYELIILIGPGEFRDAQYYVLGALGVGLVFYIVQLVTERAAMRTGAGPGVNVLAIDQGTSATKALLVGPGSEVLGRGEVPVGTRSRRRGRGGGRPGGAVRVGGRRRAAGAGRGAAPRPHAVALANQGETVLAWDRRTGAPLTPAIVWQDRRSAGVCARLADRAAELAAITGLPLDPYFAAPKMTWLRENLTADGVVTTTDTWLLARLGAGLRHRRGHRVPDAAARPGRGGLVGRRPARPSAWTRRRCRRSRTAPGSSARPPRSGRRCRSPGSPWTSRPRCSPRAAWPRATPSAPTGPGAFLLVTTGGHGRQVRLRACPRRSPGGWPARPTYCLDGQVYTAGSALRWLTERRRAARARPTSTRSAGRVPDAGGVTFVPALAGLGAPHWAPRRARAADRAAAWRTTRGHLVRAVAEGIAASVALLAAAAAADLGTPLDRRCGSTAG